MTTTDKLQTKANELQSTIATDEIEEKITVLRKKLENEKYKVAKIWKTTPINSETSLGKKNRFDVVTLVHSSHSERDLAEIFYDHLQDISDTAVVNKGVKIQLDDYPLTVVPTKFAQQGTIGIAEDEHLDLADVVGHGELLHQASALIQNWQDQIGLDRQSEILLSFEIELTLAHIIQEEEPEDLEDLLVKFFAFGEEKRFANQLNIFDKHGNILLYHDFNIPNKQHFLEQLFDARSRFNDDTKDLTLFGIN